MNEDLKNNVNSANGSNAPNYLTANAAGSPLVQAELEKQKRRQAVKEAVSGVPLWLLLPLTFALGILTVELVLRPPLLGGFGLTVVTVCAYALYSAMIIKRDSGRLRKAAALAVPVLLLAGSFAFNASVSGRGWMVLLLAGLVMLLNAVMSGSTRSADVFSFGTAADALHANIVAPFTNIKPVFECVFAKDRSAEKKASGIGTAVKVLIGLAISVPLVFILLVAMSCADAVFDDFVGRCVEYLEKLDFNFGRIFVDVLFALAFTVFAVPLVIGLRAGSRRNGGENRMSRWLDPVISATVAYMASAVYVLFVAIQLSYFFPVSLGYYFGRPDFSERIALPDNMTWAEYGRSGFFELSGIIIASFVGIGLTAAFVRRNEKGKMPVYLKAALSIISGCNVIMAVSAVMRMGLYTIWCGLTAKRIGVLMIIAVIAFALAAVIIKLWAEKFPLIKVVGIAALCTAVCFGCMNVERVCAEVNVDRHIEQGTSIDICYLGNLSFAAAPAVERLMEESPDENVRAAAAGILAKYYYKGWGSYESGYSGDALDSSSAWDLVTLDHWRAWWAVTDDSGKPWVTEDMLSDYMIYASWQDSKRDYERWNDDEFMTFESYSEENEDYYSQSSNYNLYYGW